MWYNDYNTENKIITNEVINIRIALLSDVHGNLPAFEAVLRHIDNNNIDFIYNLGDLIGKGPSPKEVVDLSMEKCNVSILGNWEDFLLNSGIDEDPIRFYRRQLDEKHLDYFKSLDYGIELYMSGRLIRIFHAHPFNVYRRVFKFSDLNTLLEMFMFNDVPGCYRYPDMSDISIYGDIHHTYHVVFDDDYFLRKYKEYHELLGINFTDFSIKYANAISQLRGRQIYNLGSVGQPFDGTTASYLVIEGEFDSRTPAPLTISFVRVPYDNRLAAEIARKSDMLDKDLYIREILTGIYRGLMT